MEKQHQDLPPLARGLPNLRMPRSCLLLCDGGAAEVDHVANGLATYLELPSSFSPIAHGEPIAVKVIHSGGAATSADAIAGVLKAAKCEVSIEVVEAAKADIDPSAAAGFVAGDCTPLLVLIGGLPHLGILESELTAGENGDRPNPNAVTDVTKDRFKAACGVLLMESSEKNWVLQHIVVPQKTWWIEGRSQYEAAD